MEDYVDIHKDLVKACQRGDRRSQQELYQLYCGAMYSICLRMLNNREEAEDLLQESFVYAFHKLSSFRFESTFGAWIKRIVVNQCINYIKKRKVDLVYDEKPLAKEAYEDSHETENQYSVNDIKNALQLLPEGYRLVFSLFLIEGYDHSEIAEILQISESTSKSQFHRAKQKMKEILKQN